MAGAAPNIVQDLHLYALPEDFPAGPPPAVDPEGGYERFLVDRRYWHVACTDLSETFGNVFSIRIGEYRVVVLHGYAAIKSGYENGLLDNRASLDLYLAYGEMPGKPNITFGLLSTNGNVWREQRKFVVEYIGEFNHGHGTMSLEAIVTNQVGQVVEMLKWNHLRTIPSGEPKHLFRMMAISILWHMSTGDVIDIRSQYMHFLYDIMVVDVGRSMEGSPAPMFYPTHLRNNAEALGWNRFTASVNAIKEFIRSRVIEHRNSYRPDVTHDFIDAYLREISTTTDPTSSFYGQNGEDNMVSTLTELFVATSVKTSGALMFALMYLCIFPDIQHHIQNEIDRIVGRCRKVTLQDRAALAYIEAFQNEVLRYSCMVPAGDFRQTTCDLPFGQFKFPAGTVVAANYRSILFDPDLWTDPEEFNPNRFLDSEGKLIKYAAMAAFGLGERRCPGELLAQSTMFLVLANILQVFDLFIPPGEPIPSVNEPVGGLLHFPPAFNLSVAIRP